MTTEPPPETIRAYWCPACGRFEIVNQAWHVRAGSISDRCDQEKMAPVLYGRYTRTAELMTP